MSSKVRSAIILTSMLGAALLLSGCHGYYGHHGGYGGHGGTYHGGKSYGHGYGHGYRHGGYGHHGRGDRYRH